MTGPIALNAVLAPSLFKRSHPPLDIKRVLLIFPFSVSKSYSAESVAKGGHYVEAPIGLGYISAFVKKNVPGLEIEVFDANAMALKHIRKTGMCDMEELFGLLKNEIEARRPDVVGVSCLFDSTAATAHRHFAVVRDISPYIFTVIGGNYATGVPKVALSDQNLDFVIFSEGEEAFAKLLIALREGIEPSEAIPGIAYDRNRVQLKAAGRLNRTAVEQDEASFMTDIVEIPKGALPEEIDDFPIPDRSTLDMNFYATQSRHTIRRTLPKEQIRIATMTASRGCPFKCTFCSSKDFWGQTIRYRDPKLVVDEMRMLQGEYGINTFIFNDDNIMFDRRAVLALCDEIKRANLEIHWMSGGGIQVTAMKKDVIQAVYETGLRQFNLAIETGNPETLKRIKKPLIKGIAEQVIQEIRKYGDPYILSNFITGFWFETKQDIEETLAYCGSLDLDWRSIYSFQPLRGTEDYSKCVELGYVKDRAVASRQQFASMEDAGSGVEILEMSTEHWSADWVRDKNYLANLEYNYVKNRNYEARPEQMIRDVDYVIELVPDHAVGYYAKGRALQAQHQYAEALAQFEKAEELVEITRDAKQTHISTLFGFNPDSAVRWYEYFEKLGIDIGSHVREARALAQEASQAVARTPA